MKKDIEKVLLFSPPVLSSIGEQDINPYPPLGLAYISAVLRTMAVDVKIVDCYLKGMNTRIGWDDKTEVIGLDVIDIEEEIRNYEPDIVGVNNLFSRQAGLVEEIFLLTKYVNEEIITIAGGAHVSANPDALMEDSNIDIIIIGEGEEIIGNIISALKMGYSWESRLCSSLKNITDFCQVPFPDWDTANLPDYFGFKMSHGYRKYEKFAPVQTSRGCPVGCTFCTADKVWGKKFRPRTPEDVIDELFFLKDNYKVQEIMFEDDNLTLNPKRAEKLFGLMIFGKLNLAWDTPNGVAAWTLSEKLIDLMKESGCYKLNFALESGSQRVLDKIIKKPLNLKKVKPLVKYARDIGLDVGIFLVTGMPGETFEDIKKSFDLCRELGIYFPHVSFATPYPGSSLYRTCKELDYIPQTIRFEDYHIRNFMISTPDWTSKELVRFVKKEKQKLRLESLYKDPIGLVKKAVNKWM